MEKYFDTLKKCRIFENIAEEALVSVLQNLSAVKRPYAKNSFIFFPEEEIKEAGIVLSGSILVVKEDFWGNRTIIDKAERGETFGEVFCFSEKSVDSPGIIACEDCEILFIDLKKLCSGETGQTNFIILNNMLSIMADKTIMMNRKIEHIIKRTTRDKLLSYLSAQAAQSGKSVFDIPFNRQELADFLAVDRSAMSSELSKLKNEGIIDFQRNHFELKENFKSSSVVDKR